jgi:sec-independent protein translocase protein TatC
VEEQKLPLSEHFQQLRLALFKSLIAVLLGFCITYYFSDSIVHFLEQPILDILPPSHNKLYFTGITDKFFTYFRISIYSAIALTLPYLLFELWKFVSPALYPSEKRFAVPFLFFATFAFALGLAFGFYLVIPHAYRFLIQFGSDREQPLITLKDYLSLTIQLLFAMGLVFELPIVILLLAKVGVLKLATLRQLRSSIYVALAILAAVITPTPDAFTMIMTWIPLCLLFEFSLFLVKWFSSPHEQH